MTNMRTRYLVPIVAAVLAVGVGLGIQQTKPRQARDAATHRTARDMDDLARRAADSAFADTVLAAYAPPGPDIAVQRSTLPPPERDADRIAWLLATRSAGTYLDELLAARDSVNYRWPDRRAEPLRVWVQDAARPGMEPEYAPLVREAFETWAEAGIPLAFLYILDSARAEIRVTWVDRFEAAMTGRTRWAHDQHGWIVGGSIQLALHQPDGRALNADAVRAIARHEVGHLVGLDHTAGAAHVMSARVGVTELSEADRATARLIYQLPPGPLGARPKE